MPFNIEFDYRFDTFGFFSTEVRAALEEVARIWENIIQDEFPDFDAGQTVSVRNPETNDLVSVTLDRNIDDLLIFVGSDTGTSINMGSTTSNILADAGPSGFDTAFSDLNSLRIADDFRGQGPTTDFEPYIGTARFNRDVDWNFSISGPVAGKTDFISVALHEFGHILGVGPSATYSAFVTGNQFSGPNGVTTNSGLLVPLQSTTDDHVQDGFLNDTVLMDPSITEGVRNLPSDIDKALLADIGYEIAGFTKQGTPFALATDSAESIFGRTIADEINGLAGNDTIQGGDGNDSLSGGAGDDQIFGQNGVDAFYIGFGDQQTTINDFNTSNETIFVDPDFGFTTAQAVLDTLTQPFSNVVELVLGNGATVSIFDNPASPAALSTANIAFGRLGQTTAPDPDPTPDPDPGPTPNPTTAILDSGNSNINIDGATNILTDFGGSDTYTILGSMSADVTITDTNASTILLPTGLAITSSVFLSNGVQLTVNSHTLTLLGDPASFTFIFGGTPLDPAAGTALTFTATAVAFGTTVPASGEAANAGTISGAIMADGTVTTGSGVVAALTAFDIGEEGAFGLPEINLSDSGPEGTLLVAEVSLVGSIDDTVPFIEII